jgi:hypothetical protein
MLWYVLPILVAAIVLLSESAIELPEDLREKESISVRALCRLLVVNGHLRRGYYRLALKG